MLYILTSNKPHQYVYFGNLVKLMNLHIFLKSGAYLDLDAISDIATWSGWVYIYISYGNDSKWKKML